MQNTMRRPNVRIIGVEENEDFKADRTPNGLDKKRNSFHYIRVKTQNAENKERILKAVRKKGQVTYKDRPIRVTPDFSPETLKSRRS